MKSQCIQSKEEAGHSFGREYGGWWPLSQGDFFCRAGHGPWEDVAAGSNVVQTSDCSKRRPRRAEDNGGQGILNYSRRHAEDGGGQRRRRPTGSGEGRRGEDGRRTGQGQRDADRAGRLSGVSCRAHASWRRSLRHLAQISCERVDVGEKKREQAETDRQID